MNNAAFLPLPKAVAKAVGISVFVGMFSGFAGTHTLQGAILGAIMAPIGAGVMVGLVLGGCYLGMEAIPNGWRNLNFRHLKMGATVRTADTLAMGAWVAAPSQYLSTRVPDTDGTIVGWGDTVWVVQHGDGSQAAYNPEELTTLK